MDIVVVYNAYGDNHARFFQYEKNARTFVQSVKDLGYTYKVFEYDGDKFNPIDLD